MTLYQVAAPASEAARLFNDAYFRFRGAQALLLSFRLVSVAGFRSGAGRPLLANLHKRLVKDLEQGLAAALPEAIPIIAQLKAEPVLDESVSSGEANALLAIDVAALLCAHIFFDQFVSQACLAVALGHPSAMAERLRDRKVSLSAAATSHAALIESLSREFAATLDRESLAKRIQFLFAVCKPSAGFAPVEGFTFDAAELERIDAIRQEIVHRARFAACPTAVDSRTTTLAHAGEHIAHMIAESGLPLSLEYLREYAANLRPLNA